MEKSIKTDEEGDEDQGREQILDGRLAPPAPPPLHILSVTPGPPYVKTGTIKKVLKTP